MGPCWFHHLHILPAGGAETFHYTRQGRCAAGMDDAADLDNTRHAFNLLGTVLVGHGWGTPWGWAGLVPTIPLPSPRCWWERWGWTPRCWGAQISAGCSHLPSLWDVGIPPQHWGQPLTPPLCPQVSPRLTSWSSSPSSLPSCIWVTSRSEGGTATGTGASWRWARARSARPHRDPHPGGAGDTSVPLQPTDEALRWFCKLLGIEEAQVTRWLCHRKLVTAGETYLKPLSRQQALDSRDALAKHMYGQVFRWMASRVNRALRSPEGHHTSIGILDIYG